MAQQTIGPNIESQPLNDNFSELYAHLAETTTEVVNIKTAYNAVGDGLRDDSLAFQNAFNNLPENAILFIPHGIYKVAGVTISKPVKIVGYGIIVKADQSKRIFEIDLGSEYATKEVIFEGITIDGNEQGNIGVEDVYARGVGRLAFYNVTFKKPSKASVFAHEYINKLEFDKCIFEGGMEFSGASEETATFHIKNWANCYLRVQNCSFETDITFDPGDGTQAGVISAAPIAIYSINAIDALIINNKSINAGHIDLYSLNHKATVFGNKFYNCHHPAIKVQESSDALIIGNSIRNNLCKWTYAIIVQGYSRASTYGSLEDGQYYGVIESNIIDVSASGGIMVNGTPISPAITDRNPSITDDLIVYGYRIAKNIIKNTQLSGISIGYIAESEIESNYIKNFGLSNPTSAFNAAGLVLQKPRGIIKINKNDIIGDGINSKFCIVNNYDGISSIVSGSIVKVSNNFTKGTVNYPILFRYIETVEILDNYCTDDFVPLIKVDYATNANILGNIGFDLSNSAKMALSNITNLVTDFKRKAKNISHGTAAPTTGTWSTGDIVYNTTPTAGGYIGWVCVAGGTPGTWKGFGAISA